MTSTLLDLPPLESATSTARRQNFARAGLAGWIARTAVALILRLFFRLRVEGRQHLPQHGPFLLAANHRSWVDPFLLEAALPLEPRPYFLGDKAALEATAFRRVMLRTFGGVVPIARGRRVGDEAALTAAVRVLEGGGVLGIFPEGTVESEEGEMLPVQRGIAHIALRARVPIVPVSITGTKELYLGKQLTVTFGPAFVPEPGTGSLPVRVGAVRTQVDDAMRALLRPYDVPLVRRKPLRNWLTKLF